MKECIVTNPLIDLLNQIRTQLPETQEGVDANEVNAIFEQLETGIEGQASVISERDTMIATLSTTVTDLKGKNYDLLTKIPQLDTDTGKEDKEDVDRPKTIDDLF
jgi:hypothetical protein